MKRVKKYEFSEVIRLKLQSYKNYLQQNNYNPKTIVGYKTKAGIFLQWLEQKKELIEEANYHSIKDFVISLREEHSIKQINYILIAVKHYYRSLDLAINPVLGIQQKGANNNLQHYFIEYEELEEIYEDYPLGSDKAFRNKVILGFSIYQGILVGELSRLRPENVLLKKGKIEIVGHRKTKRRVLDIATVQLLDLQEYLLQVRPRMLARIKSGEAKARRGKAPEKIDPELDNQLFFSEAGSVHIKSSLQQLFVVVQKMNRKISSGKVIRSTLIIHWLKTHDIRMVQYMAGHKFVSTTERYQAFNFKELEDELRNFHPLK